MDDQNDLQHLKVPQLKKAKLVLGHHGTVRELAVRVGEYELELQLPEPPQLSHKDRLFNVASVQSAMMGSGATLFLVALWLLQHG